ncbi:Glycerophosphocholine phosphodiesterase [Saxophila tyrrhenica]|uniref:Glycerophosphocholine phosphodiesterase n=1 Tax=Saxophila tyrrhenica TaxID=1690608 RepID=A0AAV9P2Q8_9PEZI|nr:Glycerophosphocholine phosphodiesterase [Saxophila tyrrhenica]
MKFGQNLPRNQVPEWASSYIDYKALKKLIKTEQKTVEAGEDPDLAGFFYTLDRQLENVDTFYNRKYGDFSRRLRLLQDRFGVARRMPQTMDKQDMEELMEALLEIRGQYRKLQWYGEVNRRGFIKITKKLNKKIPSSTAQSRYLTTKVDPKSFATNNKLLFDLRGINEYLSSLKDVKTTDDASSIHSGSSGSLRHMASKATLQIPPTVVETMETAVKSDDSEQLFASLNNLPFNASEEARHSLHLDLLQRAITQRAFTCIEALLGQVSSIEQDEDMNQRNCLHRLVISMGRARALEMSNGKEGTARIPNGATYINAAEPPVKGPGSFRVVERDPDVHVGKDEQAEQLLRYILDHLSQPQRQSILSKDTYGRLPLHYAAQYGLVQVSLDLIRYMEMWELFDTSDGLDAPAWQDGEGYAPYHLAVINGHYRTAKALLLVDDRHQFTSARLTSDHVETSGAALALATKSNYHQIVKLLVDAGVDINYQDEHGETALHLAARFGYDECVQILLAGSETRQMNLELAEKTYGWTPLFIGCVDGHLSIVKLLVDRGADLKKLDLSGWSAQEHAALRGHLHIAKYLAQFTPPPSIRSSPELFAQDSTTRLKAASLVDRRSNAVSRDGSTTAIPTTKSAEPVKEFGHRYLQDESMVLVSLGSIDDRKSKNTPPVVLEGIELTQVHSTQLDTALSLKVSAHGAKGEQSLFDLPIQENISTSPVTFLARDPMGVKIYFDLVPTYAGDPDKPENRVARGVALLSSIKPNVGVNRMTLQGESTVALLSLPSLEVIGEVNFNFLVIRPFKHPNMSISEDRTYWKKSSTMVIGHRGSGKNMSTKTSLQLGENTMQSFITAANLGASYVEFDVQMTKDHVPVIYHDFLVSETGADVPVHTLTLEQFLALGDTTPRQVRTPSPTRMEQRANGRSRKQRSYSMGAPEGQLRPDLRERMKHTRDFKEKGFKGNSRGDSIQAPFTTLEEMLKKMPKGVGFNIEMKYPMLFESEEQGMDNYAVELNSFVDTVLEMVYDLGNERNILFSSFHPDICLLLSFKQPSIPVLFLTDAGTSEVGDIRASSLQEAIRFASRWNLLGIVAASEPFVMCPRLIQVVKNSNLVCFSYGTLNNDAHNSKLQAQEGIDAVIVDSVARVRKGLTGPQQIPGTPLPGTPATGAQVMTNGITERLELSVGGK